MEWSRFRIWHTNRQHLVRINCKEDANYLTCREINLNIFERTLWCEIAIQFLCKENMVTITSHRITCSKFY